MVGMEAFSENLGLLTRKEKDWLLGNVNLPKAYEYSLRSGIRKKLRILIEFELPLLSKSGLLDMCSNRYYYNPKELHESWTGLGDGNYYDNSNLGKAKVLGPNPGPRLLILFKGAIFLEKISL
jgi:hypothetical protein